MIGCTKDCCGARKKSPNSRGL